MLGIRLKPSEDEQLARHARAIGKPKSAVARDLIMRGLERESLAAEMYRTAMILAKNDREEDYTESDMDE